MAETRCVRATVTGKVQGVFFRASTLEQAQSLGVVGSVENLPDESVQIVAQGDPDAVEALLRWAHDGPPQARVETVHIKDVPVDPELKTFSINR